SPKVIGARGIAQTDVSPALSIGISPTSLIDDNPVRGMGVPQTAPVGQAVGSTHFVGEGRKHFQKLLATLRLNVIAVLVIGSAGGAATMNVRQTRTRLARGADGTALYEI